MLKITLAALLAAITLSAPAAHATAPATPTATLGFSFLPCPQEDSINCSWNASTSGNGVGHSFTTTVLASVECVTYWAPADAHWNWCDTYDNRY